MSLRGRPRTPKYALITGASRGLGRAFADECAARGMNLFLVALPGSGLPQAAQAITSERGVRVDWLEIDLTQDDAPDRILSALERSGFETDLLINNAGIGTIGLFGESLLSGHEAVVRLNTLALVRLTHRLIPDLKRRDAAYILNVASLGAFFPMISLPVYSATKSFVLTFSLALREELRPSIGVGTLCPNTIRTDRATNDYVDKLPFICRLACLSPAEVARSGIEGLLRGQAIIVPGLINRLLRVIGPFVPRALVTRVIRLLWGGFDKEVKDATAHDRRASPRVAIVYHSAAGGTRLVAELVAEILSTDHDVTAAGIYEAGAVDAIDGSDFIVLCYPTYFLRPSPSMKEFISRLEPADRPRRAYLVTTYELYAENSLRVCALLLRDKGLTVTGSAAIRAPGADLTCVIPERLCSWLYRFQKDLPGRLRSIAEEVQALARDGGRERVPWPKWYTPFAQVLQRGLLDGFFEWRKRIRILPERCTDCGACLSVCFRGAWGREGTVLRHDPSRCELCTRCIHRCPRSAIVLSRWGKDNKRLDARLYARLKEAARAALLPPGGGGKAP